MFSCANWNNWAVEKILIHDRNGVAIAVVKVLKIWFVHNFSFSLEMWIHFNKIKQWTEYLRCDRHWIKFCLGFGSKNFYVISQRSINKTNEIIKAVFCCWNFDSVVLFTLISDILKEKKKYDFFFLFLFLIKRIVHFCFVSPFFFFIIFVYLRYFIRFHFGYLFGFCVHQ